MNYEKKKVVVPYIFWMEDKVYLTLGYADQVKIQK